MSNDEILKILCACKNPFELMAKASELRRNGESAMAVNRAMNVAKKQLTTSASTSKTFTRKFIPELKSENVSNLNIGVNSITTPVVCAIGDSIII